jgi:hypothetical protein
MERKGGIQHGGLDTHTHTSFSFFLMLYIIITQQLSTVQQRVRFQVCEISPSLSLMLSHSHSHSHSHTHTPHHTTPHCVLSLVSLAHTSRFLFSLAQTLSLSLSLSRTYTHTHTHTHCHAHTHTPTYCVLCLYLLYYDCLVTVGDFTFRFTFKVLFCLWRDNVSNKRVYSSAYRMLQYTVFSDLI